MASRDWIEIKRDERHDGDWSLYRRNAATRQASYMQITTVRIHQAERIRDTLTEALQLAAGPPRED